MRKIAESVAPSTQSLVVSRKSLVKRQSQIAEKQMLGMLFVYWKQHKLIVARCLQNVSRRADVCLKKAF
ncbi:MAG: hypothetical protein MUD08_15530 [Cytophagales bacterium]|nr:hypothetical protein [Cytophagales bacterium]